jgi:hypothetical protein
MNTESLLPVLTMLDLLFGANPITDDELRALIAKRPHVYGRFAGYLGKRDAKKWILIAVRLDDPRFGSGPATIVAHPKSVAEYLALATDRDGARIPTMRLWQTDAPLSVGARVCSELICGTGIGRVVPARDDSNSKGSTR